MRRATVRLVFCGFLLSCCAGGDWPGFRGDGSGVSDETGLPRSFGQGENVAWRVPLPGRGPASPVVVGGRVLVAAASGPREDKLHLLALDADDGEVLWHRKLWATGSSLFNKFGGVAANTPVSDGRAVYAFFSSGDLACFDLEGNLRWFRGLGRDYPGARNDVGMAASPRVVDDTVVVQMECQSDSFAAGLDTSTGETRWHIERPKGAAWTTPTVLPGPTPTENLVLLQSRGLLTAHRPRTGEQMWEYEESCHTVATLTVADGTIFLPAEGLNALKPTPAGVELLWHGSLLRSQNPSPTVHDGRAYVIKPPGILVAGSTEDGSVLWQLRLKGSFWASPVVADGHLWAVNDDGLVQVVRLGDKGELVGSGQLEPGALASPAVADGAIYFRTDTHLWKVKTGP